MTICINICIITSVKSVPSRNGVNTLGLSSPPSEEDLQKFIDLPNKRQALRAKDSNYITIFLAQSFAKKPYRCYCCQLEIPIGADHVIMRRIQMSKRWQHCHLHFNCVQECVLPKLTEIKVIDSSEASEKANNARARRYRNKHRR